ncbi:rRNA maturation RNase YbeY [Myroides sp. 1354]|uniref:rRNA maturation RNase YbeY n=1 Tax=unclassified Myroides TaxID=2642485 RepID=UPI00257843D9|nr:MULTISPECIES: rRNA maturation RNase YbeY [unclassified Myroides]MDM1043654.1 rRNA maturation RNase YbeY [Myroides sp. R163-1]MDM1054296.1 rRNA maturation RNase YbeY [Myroides sp. 1354]MDM1067592.1 rRNA maturation RNase YbeY [Myroides sp. 1372]
MITFNYELDFSLQQEDQYEVWISSILASEDFLIGEINYIFCTDEYLHEINVKYLDHDTLTDIISFDYTENQVVSGDIFISIDRVKENAAEFEVAFDQELLRVMAHGILHYCGYKDKSEKDEALMRQKEEEKMKMFHVEQ